MDTYKLSGLYLKIHSSYEVEGAYYLYGTKVVAGAPMTRYIKEAYNSAFNFYYMATEIKRNINSCSWNLIPVTESESQYFGVKPEIEVGGKYYTTLYTSFAYQLSTGMKAYYIKHNNEEMAEMTEIEGGLIPEATPVIIECTSNKVADNKLTPLSSTSKSNIQNTLKGVYFCNVIKWAMDDEEEIVHPNWNTTKYDAAKMRILGNINGKLGFVKADNLRYLPANKAYLPVQANASSNIELVDEAISNGKQVVIFSNWTQMTDAIWNKYNKKGWQMGRITGQTADTDRQQIVKLFQDGFVKVLVGTIGAMGTGLTLTAGTVEIFMDEPWNRANKEQAEDRCHRVGTTENITIYTLVCKGTIDERINELVEKKGAMADALVDGKIAIGKESMLEFLLN